MSNFKIDNGADRFSSRQLWRPPGSRGVFGGDVIGQALVAATKTVPESFVVNSFHSYFMLAGDVNRTIEYLVDRTRDGRSFVTRTVDASQNGKTIFKMIASFQIPEKFELEHQLPMPDDVPLPESLDSEEDKLIEWSQTPNLPRRFKQMVEMRLNHPIPVIIKHTNLKNVMMSKSFERPHQMIWIKAKGDLSSSPLMFHQCAAAYASDHVFLTTALLAHGMNFLHPNLKYSSTIDHSMWFHAPFRVDEFLLFEMESPRMRGNRGLVIGRFFTRDGRLVMSCSQEGLIRTNGQNSKI